MPAYYSEFDPNAAAWLRELIRRGLIADGIVDERDLWDVHPDDLRGFTQVHLCAGIGVWSHALRRARWPDERPVWTASFPCQPFSAAGKGGGFADERHLWPCGLHLIRELRPDVLFGEQVSSKDGLMWFDLVSADLEGSGYAVGAADTCSAGVGAPHIRQRLYWVAHAQHAQWRPVGLDREDGRDWSNGGRQEAYSLVGTRGEIRRLADDDEGLEGRRQPGRERAAERLAGAGGVAGGLADAAQQHRRGDGGSRGRAEHSDDGPARGVADTDGVGAERRAGNDAETAGLSEVERQSEHSSALPKRAGANSAGRGVYSSSRLPGDGLGTGPTNGLWRDADWIFCRDGKWRPVEPGTFPLAHGAASRVGRLRGYGNAINAEAARIWIEAYLDTQRVRLEGVFA